MSGEHLESPRRQAETEHPEQTRDAVPRGGSDDIFRRAALEYWLRLTTMQAEWATSVMAALDRRAKRSR